MSRSEIDYDERPLRQQAGRARAHLLTSLARKGVPWAVFALLTITGCALQLADSHVKAVGEWTDLTAGLVMAVGTTVALLDLHLRASHRMSAAGRLIGPVTTELAAVMLTAFLLAGWSVPLALLWAFGGIGACVGWDLWQTFGEHHDLSSAFSGQAERAGLGSARLSVARPALRLRPENAAAPGDRPPAPPQRRTAAQPRSRASRPRQMTGTVQLPPGEVTPAEAAARVAHLEGAGHFPPGAMSLTPHARDGSVADFRLTDPAQLDDPLPWPGPSAPGESVAVPFDLGGRQDGEPFLVKLVPVFNTRASGKTGSGKTMSWLWNRAAEGVTRHDYAMFGIDVTKMWQFLGPIREGLHAAAVTPGQALALMAGFERARVARLGYLSARHMTEWKPGCGLTYMDIAMEELGEILRALADVGKGSAASFNLDSWFTNVRAGRSAGMSWNASNQTGKHTQFPTDVRGQFSPLAFGVADLNEAKTALSDAQLDAACRPQLWGSSFPGRAYADFPTMGAGELAMPVRFYDWGQDGSAIAAYMQDWRAADRPLDDITAEALADVPAQPDSHYPPASPRGNVRDLFSKAKGPGRTPVTPDRQAAAEQAEEEIRKVLAAWLKDGKDMFTSLELQKSGVLERIGRSRSWSYNAIQSMEQLGYARKLEGGGRTRWAILPGVQRDSGEEQA
jgi:hypothetical protein